MRKKNLSTQKLRKSRKDIRVHWNDEHIYIDLLLLQSNTSINTFLKLIFNSVWPLACHGRLRYSYLSPKCVIFKKMCKYLALYLACINLSSWVPYCHHDVSLTQWLSSINFVEMSVNPIEGGNSTRQNLTPTRSRHNSDGGRF